MRGTLCFAIAIAASMASIASAAQTAQDRGAQLEVAAYGDGFVPLADRTAEAVSGVSLVVAAYATIFALLVGYSLTLWLRERSLEKAASRLAKNLAARQETNVPR